MIRKIATMKNLIIALNLLLLSSISLGQEWAWIDYLQGGGSNHTFYDLQISNNEEFVYGTGRYRATATFYGQDTNVVSPLHAGSRDVFITKTDSNGNYVWVVTDGGPSSDFGEGIATDEFDNLYVVGTTTDSAYYGNIGMLSDADGDVLIAKYDQNGNVLWAKNFTGDNWDFAKEVECDQNGNIYVAGYQGGNFDYGTGILSDNGYFVMKLDYLGNVIWCKGPTNSTIWSYSVANALELHNNELYFGGRVKSALIMDTVAVSVPTWDDVFFAKMDTTGHVNWVSTAGGVYYAACEDLVVNDTSIYVVGCYSGDAFFDTVNVFSNSATTGGAGAQKSRDAFLAKYSLDGTSCYWVKDQKGLDIDQNFTVLVDKEGSILIGGGYNEFDIYSQTQSEGDFKITAFDSDGNELWDMFPQGPRKAEAIVMKQDSQGNIYCGGRVKGDYVFNSNITVIVPGGKFTGVIGKIYPRVNQTNDTLLVCENDSATFSIENRFGDPLHYSWFNESGLAIGTDNDSIYSAISSMDSIYCVVSSGVSIDTIVFPIDAISLPAISLGSDIETCDSTTELLANSSFTWFDWGTGFVEFDSTYTVTTSGQYVVFGQNDYCVNSDTIIVTLLDCSGVEEYLNDITMYYQQSNGSLIINNGFESHGMLDVYALDGRLLFRKSNLSQFETIDLSSIHNRAVLVHYYDGVSHKGIQQKLILK